MVSTWALEGEDQEFPYVLHEQIGRGRWGTVFRATDRRTGEQVALKFVGRSGREDLLRAYEVQVALRHPALVAAHERFRLVEGACISMDLADGGSLLDLCRGSGPAQRSAWVRQAALDIAGALDRMHRAGWVHRDVKPTNLVWDAEGARLTDLGLAHPYQGAGPTPPAGSPAYMAPEVLLRWELGPAADWYALGITLWELLTGELPFDAPTLQEDLLAKQLGRLPPAPDLPEPARWRPLLAALLDPDPQRRGGLDALWQHLGDGRPAPVPADEEAGAVVMGPASWWGTALSGEGGRHAGSSGCRSATG